ncbi:MAG TPA: hypothetical protein VHE55_19890 [Fimbriimonadaceae bacterium]|nr:hypothetical protein [Fimbriimonadaceae bacterium]
MIQLFILAVQVLPLPSLDEVIANVRAHACYSQTIQTDYSLVTTWTPSYERFWVDFGPRRQVTAIERHRWSGHLDLYTDRFLSGEGHGRGGSSYALVEAFDGTTRRSVSRQSKTYEEEKGSGTGDAPEDYTRLLYGRPIADVLAEHPFAVAGWVTNPTFGRCLRLKGAYYEGHPTVLDLAPDYGWVLVRKAERRSDIPLLTERVVLRMQHGQGIYVCAEAAERQIVEKPDGRRVLLKETKLFAKHFTARPFDADEFKRLPKGTH